MQNRIGPFDFVTLTGEIDPPGPKVEAVQRPGLNGTAWRWLGYKGDQFRMESTAFITQDISAHDLMINYRQSVGGSYYMYDAIGNRWDVFIEGVKIQQPKFVRFAIWFDTFYGNGYIIKSTWTLRMTN